MVEDRTHEGKQATAAARSAQRQKWGWLALGAAVLAVVVAAALTAVLAVQQRANAELADKNTQLVNEQAKVEALTRELADERARVQARFAMAVRAIETFHTGVSEDALLKNAEFKELRTNLLKQAAGFYADLEKLLAGQTDAKSRKVLAAAYFQLAELMDRIGDKKEALAVHRKALALRRELAAAEGADVEARLEVVRSLRAQGLVLWSTGDLTAALRAFEEQRHIATALETESPTDAVRAVLAQSHNAIGVLLLAMGRSAEALQALQKALAIRQKLADANPTVATYQSNLATGHHNVGHLLMQTGKREEAMVSDRKALAIRQKLADANPAVADFQLQLAHSHSVIGLLLAQTGRPEEAIKSHRKVLAIAQKLSDANPAVSAYQIQLAQAHNDLGGLFARQKRFAEAFTAINAGLAIRKKLAEAGPKDTVDATDLGYSHAWRGWALVRSGQPSTAAADLRRAVELWAKVPAPDPDTRFERSRALALLAGLGGDANSGVTKAEAVRFADQALASLRDAFRAGWGWPDELKEPDFDALRGRDDFQKLLAEWEARNKARAAKKQAESK
jgi:tetratricopeptide (TPR) repeat protein